MLYYHIINLYLYQLLRLIYNITIIPDTESFGSLYNYNMIYYKSSKIHKIIAVIKHNMLHNI